MTAVRSRGNLRRLSFSAEAKAHLARHAVDVPAEADACFVGLVLAAGSLHLRDGERWLAVRCETVSVARAALALMRGRGLATRVLRRRGATGRLSVEGRGESLESCIQMWLTAREGRPPPGLLRTRACRRAFLRGLFLGAGSVARPHADAHLEIVLAHAGAARLACRTAAGFDVAFRTRERRDMVVVYVKGVAAVAACLRVLGASAQLLALEDERVQREMRNRVNRLVNAETANMSKAAAAAVAQVEAIQRLVAVRGWAALSPKLKELARLRLEYPEASLRELGQRCSPALGKAGASYRMRRLLQMEEALSNRRKQLSGSVFPTVPRRGGEDVQPR